MLKHLSIYLSAILMICCAMTGCSKEDNSSANEKTEEVSVSDSADNGKQENTPETNTAPTEGQTQGKPIQEIEMTDDFLMQLLSSAQKPECEIKSNAVETDFVGNWECEVMVDGDLVYDGMFGTPFFATEHMVIGADNSGSIISTKAGTEPETTETPFTWTFSDNSLKADVSGKNITMQATDDNRIVIISKDMDGNDVFAYYQKVDSFTEFDFSSVEFDFDAVVRNHVSH